MNTLIPILKKTVKQVITPSRRNHITYTDLGSGLYEASGFSMPNYTRKSDYAPVLRKLIQRGKSVQEAADICGISVPYAYKLIHK